MDKSKYDFSEMDQRVKYMTQEFGNPKSLRVEQLGDLDIEFDGWLVSECGDHTHVEDPEKAAVEVTLYYSTRGAYVAEITRNFPDFRNKGKRLTKSKAAAFVSYKDMLVWLKEDGRGWLGVNSKVAWEEMCARLPWLRSESTVRV